MAKLAVINAFVLIRRSLRGQATKAAAAAAVKEAAPPEKNKKKEEEKFWMRDPKSGNWIPESRVVSHEVDEVDQREKLLPKKNPV